MLTPKNWATFQHYKDRNPPWIKLHKGLLDDYEFQRLPVASRALAPCLWLLASEYPDGVITLTEDALQFRLRMTLDELVDAIQPLVNAGFFSCDSAVLAPCKRSAMPEESREETETEKECRIPEETAPPSAKAEKPPHVKKLKTTELKPDSVEAFQAAWETIPPSVVRWDATVRRDVEEAVAKGSRAEAERNFQAIVDARIATPRTLYVALYAYITEGEGPKKGFVQHCATFYGPKKRTYLEWLDRAREIESERYGVSA